MTENPAVWPSRHLVPGISKYCHVIAVGWIGATAVQSLRRVGWANELPWPEASFDVVVSCNMFHYVTHPVAAIRGMQRVLRPGGQIVITDWCDDYLACRLCNVYLRLTSRAHYKSWLWGLRTARATKAAV